MRRLNDVLAPLKEKKGVDIIGTWCLKGRNGITLAHPNSVFPHGGPRYRVDTTKNKTQKSQQPR